MELIELYPLLLIKAVAPLSENKSILSLSSLIFWVIDNKSLLYLIASEVPFCGAEFSIAWYRLIIFARFSMDLFCSA